MIPPHHSLHRVKKKFEFLLQSLHPQKPLEVREANVKNSPYKVCVLGLWVPQDSQGQALVDLALALESGR